MAIQVTPRTLHVNATVSSAAALAALLTSIQAAWDNDDAVVDNSASSSPDVDFASLAPGSRVRIVNSNNPDLVGQVLPIADSPLGDNIVTLRKPSGKRVGFDADDIAAGKLELVA